MKGETRLREPDEAQSQSNGRAPTRRHVETKCTRCLYVGPIDSFPMVAKLQRSTQCLQCANYRRQVNQGLRGTTSSVGGNKENISSNSRSQGDAELEKACAKDNTNQCMLVTRVEWRNLAEHLSICTVQEVEGIDLLVEVPLSISVIKESKERRAKLANEVLACTGYKFK